jgi:hypothetical protein
MRLPFYILTNIPITFGMLVASPTVFNTILWQWVNQSNNAALNYGNRNASSSYTNQDLMRSYTIAVSSSIIVALSLRKGAMKWTKNMTGSNLIVANSITAFGGSATAGYLNAYAMRQTEIIKGIDVMDPAEPSKPIGIKSSAAAKIAVSQTANSRVVGTIPLLFPSLVFLLFDKMKIMPHRFWPKTLVQGIVFCLELYIAIPMGVAFYT